MNEINTKAATLSMDALRSGQREEIAELVSIFMDPVYRLALRMTGNEQDAEDVTQETFIKVIRALPGFEGRSQLATWIYRIAMNESLMNLRKRKPGISQLEIDAEKDDDDGVEIEIVDWAAQPESELLNVEAKEELDRAITHLSENLRSVFTLRDLQGLSIEETSEVLGISVPNVKTRLLRARLKLRQELSLYYGEWLERKAGI